MSKGRNNRLTCQIGEYLVCAELGKLGLIATPFSGNVPAFDIVAADDQCHTVPIQVKATRSDNWPSDARNWMQVTLDPNTKVQCSSGATDLKNPDLIYVHVAIAAPSGKDRFFVLTNKELQTVCIKRYSLWMDTIGWRRPWKPECYECRYPVEDLEPYENNWKIISDRLRSGNGGVQC